jgi:hypothetical protein
VCVRVQAALGRDGAPRHIYLYLLWPRCGVVLTSVYTQTPPIPTPPARMINTGAEVDDSKCTNHPLLLICTLLLAYRSFGVSCVFLRV